jgi:hypothetical protein
MRTALGGHVSRAPNRVGRAEDIPRCWKTLVSRYAYLMKAIVMPR